MSPAEARKILEEYGRLLASIHESKGPPFELSSLLPCSVCRIRYAFFVEVESIISKAGKLSSEEFKTYYHSYGFLAHFVSERRAKQLNAFLGSAGQLTQEEVSEAAELYTKELHSDMRCQHEFEDFIRECQQRVGIFPWKMQ